MQSTKTIFLTPLLCCFFNLLILNAQDHFTPLFNATNQSRSNFKTDQADTKRINYLYLNNSSRSSLANLPSKMQFNLFPDVSINVHLDKSNKTYYKNMVVYRGQSKDARFAHLPHYRDVVLIYNPNTGKITAQIETDKGAFQITPTLRANTYEVSEWTDSPIDCHDYIDRTALQTHQASSRSGCNEQDANGKYVADLFVGYSHEASVIANDIDAHALSLVEMVNNGLTNSLVNNIYIRLVGTAISEHNPGVVTSVLGDVYDWFEDEIALTGADYVASIQVPTGGPSEAGGWAGVGGYSSVNSINNAAGVFRHELGHNVGSSHCTPGILPYASGFDNGNVKTHMCGNNINFYSTPLVNDEMGIPIGDAATADNARVWRERAPIVSARQKHTILFDENDTGCGSPISNGNYYIQNLNSDMYLATANGSTARGIRLVQVANQATNNQWKFLNIGNGKYRILHTSSGRAADLPNGSEDYTIWSLHGNSNQQFTIEKIGTDTFNIIGNKGECAQIRDASLVAGDTVVHRICDNSLNTKWRFIPVPESDVVNVSIAVTNVNCYGEENGMATATVTGGTGNYTLTWSNGATGMSVNNLAPGNYSVTVNDGATSFPHTFTIKQATPFDINLTKTQATSLAGANASASVVVSGGTTPYTYAWDNGETGTTANDLVAGLHTLTITDANGCSLTKEFFIDCPDALKICDDGNANTYGDHIDNNCNCVGKTFTCDNGLAVANIAIGKTATQSSTNGAADASLAIDGNRDGNFGSGSVTATNVVEGVNAWWQVDLKDETDITGILISNRTDCCTGRLEDYHVFISTTPFNSDDLTTTQNQAGIIYHHYFENATPLPDTLIELSATGQYVRIQSGSNRALHLAEVEIYACGVPTAANITANPLGENNYELKGYVIPNGATINSIAIEHGATGFANSNNIDLTGIGSVDTFYFTTIVNIGNASNYQFSIKYDTPAKSYTTNGFFFTVNSDYCTPTVGNRVWFKTFRMVALNNLVFDGNGDSYDNQLNYSFGEFEMGSSYSIGLTTPSSDWHNLTFLVYVDLNNDGDFTDYNEIVGASTPNGHTTTFTITIPTEDVLINRDLRMRIQGHEGGAFTTCFSPIGNFKDFTIRIKEGACTGTGHLVPFYRDMDMDGFGNENAAIARNCSVTAVPGYLTTFGDCDDTRATVNPNAQEICGDGLDNDCDGFIDNINVALGKTATQSSTLSNGNNPIADKAIDGNTDGTFNNSSVTHTNSQTNAWWEVDLGESHTLDSIVIWNRTDCCQDRLDNFYVFLSDAPFTSTDPTITAEQTGVWSILTANAPAEKITFQPNTNGRYLRVQLAGRESLSLAEVQAYACVGIDPPSECTFYADVDGDGFGDLNNAITQMDCVNIPAGYVADNQDFDDTDKTRYPGAMELCDNIDNDGNGQIDEGANYDTDNVTFTNETIPSEVYTASETINTTQTVTVNANTDVHFIAGQSISLQPGFSVSAGADFFAQIIDDCNTPFTNTEKPALLRTAKNPQTNGGQLNMQVSPNPFYRNTIVTINIPAASKVSLSVYSMNGQLMETIVDQVLYPKGLTSIDFMTKTSLKGLHYFVLKTEKELLTKKVVILEE